MATVQRKIQHKTKTKPDGSPKEWAWTNDDDRSFDEYIDAMEKKLGKNSFIILDEEQSDDDKELSWVKAQLSQVKSGPEKKLLKFLLKKVLHNLD